MTLYVNVLLARNTDRLFTYSVPTSLENAVQTGRTVTVPFRRATMNAFVIELSDSTELTKVKDIIAVDLETPVLLGKEQVDLARKLADYYFCSFLSALYLFLPPGMDKRNKQVVESVIKIISFAQPPTIIAKCIKELSASNRTVKMAEVLRKVVKNGGTLPLSEILNRSSVNTLIKKGLIKIDEVKTSRMPEEVKNAPVDHKLKLTQHQEQVFSEVVKGSEQFYLIHGVTGSGKTEVYMRVIDDVLMKNKTALMLVPEISLTPQTVSRFYSRFGNRVAVLHSSLSVKERRDQWYKILHGDASIVVGARSAIFAPLQRLGVIIIDEEHETSYKQDTMPRYHAVTVAGWMVRMYGAKLVLGSATPSVERFYYAGEKVIKLLSMPQKVLPTASPLIEVVDMRKEQENSKKKIFSRALITHIKSTLERKEQILLLLNRRGLFPVVICRDCGYAVECPHCEVSMTLHNDGYLYCHYCGYKRDNRPVCPECSSHSFSYLGMGTQKIEQEFRSYFPNPRVLRMDRDTTKNYGSLEAILAHFAAGAADVLIGTQMIAKGHDFSNVGLVGVVLADVGLHIPDFRASERTFSLLSQVSGRTGRRGRPGTIVIQSYIPENYAISLLEHDKYDLFYEKEISVRKMLAYPPFVRLARIIFQSVSVSALNTLQDSIDKYIKDVIPGDITINGPLPAPIPKIASRERWHMIIKTGTIHRLHYVVRLLLPLLRSYEKDVKWQIDIDPVSML